MYLPDLLAMSFAIATDWAGRCDSNDSKSMVVCEVVKDMNGDCDNIDKAMMKPNVVAFGVELKQRKAWGVTATASMVELPRRNGSSRQKNI